MPSLAMATGCMQWPAGDFSPDTTAHHLIAPAYGLYWVKYNQKTRGEDKMRAYTSHHLLPYETNGAPNNATDPMEDGGAAKQMYNATLFMNGFFDPKKPTIIIIHGWQPMATQLHRRFNLCYQYPLDDNGTLSPVYNTLQYWSGWNVAVFYWTQFADELDLHAAEAKIYSANTDAGMRWTYLLNGDMQSCDGSLSASGEYHCYMPKQSVAALAEEAVREALPANYHHALRIAGESLGAQVAIALTDQLVQAPFGPKPTQLILLDPYFSTANTDLFQMSIAAHANLSVQDVIAHNVGVTEYRTSTVSQAPRGDWDPVLMDMVAYMRLYPNYLSGLTSEFIRLGEQHRAAVYLYLQSHKAPAYWNKDTMANWGRSYLNAQSTDAEVQKMMGLKRYQQPSDDNLSEANFEHTEKDRFSSVNGDHFSN